MEFPRVGEEIEGYRLESVIARGGMSVVFQAEHLRLGRRVALKVLASELSEDDVFRERFVRESRVAAGLEHPNIIPIYEAGESGGNLYLAMRYVHGPHLKELVKQVGPLSPRRLIPILGQVGSALDAAHVRGLIHRDVKPGNILVDPEVGPGHVDHVYLCDFGLTKQTTSHSGLTRTGQFVGTIDYIAPEQVEGKEVDARTDIYSLGCVVYECLTGMVPFEKSTEAAVLWAHVQEPPPLVSAQRPDLSNEIDGVVAKAMSKDPADRPASCAELLKDARAALGVSDSTLPGGDITTVRPLAVEEQRTVARAKESGPAVVEAKETAPAAGEPPARPPSAPRPKERGRGSRPSQSRVLVAAVIALLLGIGGGWLLKSSTADTSATSDVADGHGMETPGEQQVIFDVIVRPHIPEEFSGDCSSGAIPSGVPFQEHEVYAVAHCKTQGVTVDYMFIHSTGAMKDGFHTYVMDNNILPSPDLAKYFETEYEESGLTTATPNASCESAFDTHGTWAGFSFQGGESDASHVAEPSRQSLDQPPRGFVACFQRDAAAYVVWTDGQPKFFMIASSNDPAALLHWWETMGGPHANPIEPTEPTMPSESMASPHA